MPPEPGQARRFLGSKMQRACTIQWGKRLGHQTRHASACSMIFGGNHQTTCLHMVAKTEELFKLLWTLHTCAWQFTLPWVGIGQIPQVIFSDRPLAHLWCVRRQNLSIRVLQSNALGCSCWILNSIIYLKPWSFKGIVVSLSQVSWRNDTFEGLWRS